MNIHGVDWSVLEWRPIRRGIERKAFTTESVTLALHRVWPGHEVLPHSHPNEQVVYILEGEAEFSVGDGLVRVRAGSLITVPPNVQHCIRVVGDQPVLNLDVFTPARPEYVHS
jgi:quercetin dioxygenase-like cupin family protein